MNPGEDKSWPPIAPSELRLSQPAASAAGPDATVPPPPPPPPAANLGALAAQPLRSVSTPLSWRDWVVRGLVCVLLVAALGLLYWSYSRLIPLQQKARTLGDRVAKLSQDIAVMENKYSPQTLDMLARQFQLAGQLLFGEEEALTAWFAGLQRQLVPLALEASAEFGQPTSRGRTNFAVAVVPATLTLNLEPAEDLGAVRSPYARVLGLLNELGGQTQRVDLVELEVTAGSNSINRVRTVVELWAGEDGHR